MASFLSRSFRRTLHGQHEGKIIKNISAGQNLEVCCSIFELLQLFDVASWVSLQVKDRTWDILREQGAMIEEAADDDDDTEEEGAGEPRSFDEKVLAADAPLSGVNLVPGGIVQMAPHFPQAHGTTVDDLR